MTKIFRLGVLALALTLFFSAQTFGQKKRAAAKKAGAAKKSVQPTVPANLPVVKQIDGAGLNAVLRRDGENAKPLLVNFWATWCAPCIEEFPDLVKIDADYKGKIDFVTITLDDPSELNTSVPKFLAKMKAEMPTYLLYTEDPSVTISAVFKDWSGALPFTVLYDGKGKVVYSIQGKVKLDKLHSALDESLTAK